MTVHKIETQLPQDGQGFRRYKSTITAWGRWYTVQFIQRLSKAWIEAHPGGPRLQIGDISIKGGGRCPNGRHTNDGQPLYHKSHDKGIDFDVQIIRGDGREGVRSVTIDDPSTHPLTRQLVQLICALAPDGAGDGVKLEKILTANPSVLVGEGVNPKQIRLEKTHRYHLHVRLK